MYCLIEAYGFIISSFAWLSLGTELSVYFFASNPSLRELSSSTFCPGASFTFCNKICLSLWQAGHLVGTGEQGLYLQRKEFFLWIIYMSATWYLIFYFGPTNCITKQCIFWIESKGLIGLWKMCEQDKKEYVTCLKTSGFKSEKCRHLSKKYLECRMER